VKNWGAWGSMAPPTTVDIMGFSFATKLSRAGRNNKLAAAGAAAMRARASHVKEKPLASPPR
jgi:hypothetical protein